MAQMRWHTRLQKVCYNLPLLSTMNMFEWSLMSWKSTSDVHVPYKQWQGLHWRIATAHGEEGTGWTFPGPAFSRTRTLPHRRSTPGVEVVRLAGAHPQPPALPSHRPFVRSRSIGHCLPLLRGGQAPWVAVHPSGIGGWGAESGRTPPPCGVLWVMGFPVKRRPHSLCACRLWLWRSIHRTKHLLLSEKTLKNKTSARKALQKVRNPADFQRKPKRRRKLVHPQQNPPKAKKKTRFILEEFCNFQEVFTQCSSFPHKKWSFATWYQYESS